MLTAFSVRPDAAERGTDILDVFLHLLEFRVFWPADFSVGEVELILSCAWIISTAVPPADIEVTVKLSFGGVKVWKSCGEREARYMEHAREVVSLTTGAIILHI